MRNIKKEIRGISPLIATLILIAATVAGGAVIYTVMRSQAGSLSGGADLQIMYADIIVAGNTKLATVTVKNVGSVAFSDITISVTTNSDSVTLPVSLPSGGLASGMTVTGENTTGSWTANANYVVTVTGTYSGGSVVKSMTVRAHS
jgi:flagellin-like protein